MRAVRASPDRGTSRATEEPLPERPPTLLAPLGRTNTISAGPDAFQLPTLLGAGQPALGIKRQLQIFEKSGH